ncbi:CBS domain protein [uncultured archaeon]|nr:CBS domain protein [uncultured archaeon]
MYFPTGTDLKKRRETLGLSQKQVVARLAGRGLRIRQPYLSKIEGEKAEPAYRLVRELVAVLDEAESAQEPETLEGYYHPRPSTAAPQDGVADVIRKIRRNGFSQLPVFEKGKNVGRITDAMVLAAERKYGPQGVRSKTVAQIMGPPYPVLSALAPKSEAELMVERIGAVLVEKEGKLVGIVTREDLLA